jgi:hypothetical protein
MIMFAVAAVVMSPVAIATLPSTVAAQAFESKTFHDWILFTWCGGSKCSLPGPDTCCFVEAS